MPAVLQVQRAAAGALRTLAFKNEDNKNQIVECGALPTLIQMLRAEDVGIHYEAVGVIGNLVHSSQHIKRKVQHRACVAACQKSYVRHVYRLVVCMTTLGQPVAGCIKQLHPFGHKWIESNAQKFGATLRTPQHTHGPV